MSVTSVNSASSSAATASSTSTSNNTLDLDDFYTLLAAQLQNQDITNPTDQTDFLNQMIMMTVVNAIETFTDISTTSYAASLVGKDVTVAAVNDDGTIKEVYGTVTATGLYAGEQIIFIDDKSYKLSQIMSIGKLPDTTGTDDSTGAGDTTGTDGSTGTGDTTGTDGSTGD